MCDLFTGRTADSRRLIVDDMREICHRPLAEGGLGLRADTSSLHPGDRISHYLPRRGEKAWLASGGRSREELEVRRQRAQT